jgi:type VI secretion system protein ImpF
MAEASVQSRREAVQPSLWDRLVDELPGLSAEIDLRRDIIVKEIGAARVEALLAGGSRAIEQATDLYDDTRKDLHRLLGQVERQAWLQERGIVVTASVLREAVRRDIEMLFNTERLEAEFLLTDIERIGKTDPADLLAGFPEVRRSVVNYGVPAFAGRSGRDFDRDELARELREILAVFEPRLKRDTIRVKVATGDRAGLRIDIDAVLMLSPVPERLRLSTSIDLDSGKAATVLDDS